MKFARLRLSLCNFLRSTNVAPVCESKYPLTPSKELVSPANGFLSLSASIHMSPALRSGKMVTRQPGSMSSSVSFRPFTASFTSFYGATSFTGNVHIQDDNESYSAHSALSQRQCPEVIAGHCRRISSETVNGSEVTLERLENDDAGIVIVSMDRPSRKNAIGKTFLRELQDAIEDAQNDRRTRVMLIRSLVPGVFCAGADLKERHDQTALEVQHFVQRLRGTYADLEALCIPSIAVVEGKALGGGCELALACDLRVAGEKAEFGLPETGLAIIPGAGATQRLPRVIGKALAKELIYTGTPIGAEKAERIGLANHTVPAGKAYEKALELARRILTRGPIAIRMAKTAMDRGVEVDITTGLAIEEACYAQLLPTKDRVEALVAFKEKRAPLFKGE